MIDQMPDDFEILQGKGLVMLSAPHGVEHTRAGRVKPAEVQTSDLARDLHRSLHCPVIIKTKSNDDDPNYDEHSPYRDALVDYVKENDARVVFDLHQLSSEREAAFILGTADGKNLRDDITLSTLCRCLEDLGIGVVLVDEVFKASGPNTVAASTAKRADVSCIQIEINSKYLCKDFPEYAYDRIRDALEECITSLNSNFADPYRTWHNRSGFNGEGGSRHRVHHEEMRQRTGYPRSAGAIFHELLARLSALWAHHHLLGYRADHHLREPLLKAQFTWEVLEMVKTNTVR